MTYGIEAARERVGILGRLPEQLERRRVACRQLIRLVQDFPIRGQLIVAARVSHGEHERGLDYHITQRFERAGAEELPRPFVNFANVQLCPLVASSATR